MKIKTKILGLSHTGQHYSVVLEDLTEHKVKLPIIISDESATHISKITAGIETIYSNLINASEVGVREIYINDFDSGIFSVKVTMDNDNYFTSPVSEALILAYVSKCEIYISDEIMKVSGIKLKSDETVDYGDIEYDSDDGDEELTSLEELEVRLEIAIEEENYEEAGKIRDEINNFNK